MTKLGIKLVFIFRVFNLLVGIEIVTGLPKGIKN